MKLSSLNRYFPQSMGGVLCAEAGRKEGALGRKQIERGGAGFFARLVAALYKAAKSDRVSRKTARWSLALVHSHTALMTPRVTGPRVRARATKCEVFLER